MEVCAQQLFTHLHCGAVKWASLLPVSNRFVTVRGACSCVLAACWQYDIFSTPSQIRQTLEKAADVCAA